MNKPEQRFLPEHLAPLEKQELWAIWRAVGLRSAGFPIEYLQAFASQVCNTSRREIP